MYKTSYYNFYIHIPEKQAYLLYNSYNNGLYEIDKKTGEQLKKWSLKSEITDKELSCINQEYLEELINDGFLVKNNMDEIQLMQDKMEEHHKSFLQYGGFALTIIPTNACNLACPYCYLGSLPSKSKKVVMNDEVMESIIELLENEIIRTNKKFTKLNVTWFGGEPLLATNVVNKLSKKFIKFSKENNIEYKSKMITNGVNLTKDNWQLLQKLNINTVQITLDGNRDHHNKNRPLKGEKAKSFDTILDNLKYLPDNIKCHIRINIDKQIFNTLPDLFKELNKKDIWPQKINNVYLYLGHKFDISGKNHNFYARDEFAKINSEFSKIKLEFYNSWASKNKIKKAKFKFHYPKRPFHYCLTANHPYGMVIGHDGNVYKCWEYCNSQPEIVGNVQDGYESINRAPKFQKAINFDKTLYDNECRICKFLPICDMGACMAKHLDNNNKKLCTIWKYNLKRELKKQYLMMMDEPEKIQSFKEAFQKKDKNLFLNVDSINNTRECE